MRIPDASGKPEPIKELDFRAARARFATQVERLAPPDVSRLTEEALATPGHGRSSRTQAPLFGARAKILALAAAAAIIPALLLPVGLISLKGERDRFFYEAIAGLAEDTLGIRSDYNTSEGETDALYYGWELSILKEL